MQKREFIELNKIKRKDHLALVCFKISAKKKLGFREKEEYVIIIYNWQKGRRYDRIDAKKVRLIKYTTIKFAILKRDLKGAFRILERF